MKLGLNFLGAEAIGLFFIAAGFIYSGFGGGLAAGLMSVMGLQFLVFGLVFDLLDLQITALNANKREALAALIK